MSFAGTRPNGPVVCFPNAGKLPGRWPYGITVGLPTQADGLF